MFNTGGSRLDQIWARPSIGFTMPIAFFYVGMGHLFRSLHCYCSFRVRVANDRNRHPHANLTFMACLHRQIKRRRTQGSDYRRRRGKNLMHKGLIDSSRCILATFRQSFACCAFLNPSEARGSIESAFFNIKGNMLDAIPWSQAASRMICTACFVNTTYT